MNTPMDKDNEQLARQAKAMFDDSVDRLDSATLSKLNQGRQAALAEVSSRDARVRWGRWVPLTGVAAAAVVAVVMLQGPTLEGPPDGGTATDFEILIGDDSLEMIEELEFYSWIDVADLESTDNVG